CLNKRTPPTLWFNASISWDFCFRVGRMAAPGMASSSGARLTHSRVIGVLANPSYAGTYVFGRYQSCKQIDAAGEICTRLRQMPEEQWRIVIADHHPGFITWEQFLTNRRRLTANRTNNEVFAGPVREGLCLLQGVLFCGICGRRLTVRYQGNRGLYPI